MDSRDNNTNNNSIELNPLVLPYNEFSFTICRMVYLKIGKVWAFIAGIAVAVTLTGCGGVSASHAVSPASFFLPGLVKNQTSTHDSQESFIEVSDFQNNPAITEQSEVVLLISEQ